MLRASRKWVGRHRGYLALFGNLSFMLLWMGQLISYLGDRLNQLTLLGLVKKSAPDANPDAVMTYVLFFALLPHLLFASWAGPVADRYSRKAILLWISLFLGAFVAAFPLAASIPFVQHHAVAMVYGATFVIGAFTIFFYTAKTALIPQVVGDGELMEANSLSSFAGTLMTLIGTFVAAALLRLVDRKTQMLGYTLTIWIMFYLDAASYFLSGAMFAFITVPKRRVVPATEAESFGRKLREGLRYVVSHRQVLKLILLSTTVAFSAGLVFAVITGAALGREWLNLAPSDYALAIGVLGCGMIAGAVGTTLFQKRIRSFESYAAGCFVVAALAHGPFFALKQIVAMALPPLVVVWGILAPQLFVIGACGGALIVLVMTLLQRSTPRRFHGRIFALNGMCEAGAQLAALGGAAWLLDHNLLKTVFALDGGVLVLAALGTLVSNEFTRHWLVRSAARLFLKLYCRAEYEGRAHVPLRGELIVSSNHVSWLDTVILGSAVPRLIHYLAASEYYNRWYLKWIMWLYGTIPVERGKGKRKPLRRAVLALRRGRVVGIFPEGGMTRNGQLQAFEGGVGLLAQETGASILPVAILGGYEIMGRSKLFPRPHKLRVRIGAPIDPTGLSRKAILTRVEAAIRGLLGQADAFQVPGQEASPGGLPHGS